MLRLDLNELEREGRVRLSAEVPAHAAIWDDVDLPFKEGTGLSVRLEATMAGGAKVLVRGSLRATLRGPCRRCLNPVDQEFEEHMAVLYAPPEEIQGADEDVRPLEPLGHLLDVTDAVREEAILGAPRYVLCDPDCKGLCPRCGANLNETECDCASEEPDPRWNALRELVED